MTDQDRTPQKPQEPPQSNQPPVPPAETEAHSSSPVQERATELRVEEEKQQERKRNLIILGVVAVIAIIAAVIFFWVLPEDNETPENPVIAPTEQETVSPDDSEEPDATAEPTVPPVEPPVEEETEGIIIPAPDAIQGEYAVPGNTNENGGVTIGSDLIAGTVNEGAPVMDIYLDYSCPYCHQFEETHADDIRQLLTDGEVTVVYHTIAMLDQSEELTGFSGEAVNAAATVANFAPGHYYDFINALFAADSPVTDPLVDRVAPLPEVQEIARSVNIPEDVVEFFSEGLYKDWSGAKTMQFFEEGFQSTPTVLINGEPLEDWTVEGSVVEAVANAS